MNTQTKIARPLLPGDLVEYLPVPGGRTIIGVVLKHKPKVSPWVGELPDQGPGVIIYWMTTHVEAPWLYERINEEMGMGNMKVISRPSTLQSIVGGSCKKNLVMVQ